MDNLSPKMKTFLLILNCLMLAIGQIAGPLIMRLYYLKGGRGYWLNSWLETGGWPLTILALLFSYFRRRANDPAQAKLVYINVTTFFFSCFVGIIAGLADYCYAFGVQEIPVSTSSLILATQLAFTAVFAFLLVGQKFTAYTVNAIALLTLGATVLAVHASGDKPARESRVDYYLGWFVTLAAAALFSVMLPMIELTHKKAHQRVNYALAMEIQLVLSLSATILCTIGMLASGEYKTYAKEAEEYELGKRMYIVVLICSAIAWQFFYIGAAGVIYYGSSLLSGVIIAIALPVTEIGAVIFFHEKFQVDKGVSLVISFWGFFSYFYGEAKQMEIQESSTESSDVEAA